MGWRLNLDRIRAEMEAYHDVAINILNFLKHISTESREEDIIVTKLSNVVKLKANIKSRIKGTYVVLGKKLFVIVFGSSDTVVEDITSGKAIIVKPKILRPATSKLKITRSGHLYKSVGGKWEYIGKFSEKTLNLIKELVRELTNIQFEDDEPSINSPFKIDLYLQKRKTTETRTHKVTDDLPIISETIGKRVTITKTITISLKLSMKLTEEEEIINYLALPSSIRKRIPEYIEIMEKRGYPGQLMDKNEVILNWLQTP